MQIKSTQDFYVLVMVALSYYCCRSSLLRNGIHALSFSCNFSEELSRENKMNFSGELYLNSSIIHHLLDENN